MMITPEEYSFIEATRPRMLITLAPRRFNVPMPDPVAIDYSNRLFKLVNTKLFKNRFKRKEQYLSGFAVLEHTIQGAPHIHALITNDLDVDLVRDAFLANAKRFTWQIDTSTHLDRRSLRNRYKRGVPGFYIKNLATQYIREVPIFGQDEEGRGGIDVKGINQTSDDYERVINYLQKEYRGFMLVTADGVIQNDDVGQTLSKSSNERK